LLGQYPPLILAPIVFIIAIKSEFFHPLFQSLKFGAFLAEYA